MATGKDKSRGAAEDVGSIGTHVGAGVPLMGFLYRAHPIYLLSSPTFSTSESLSSSSTGLLHRSPVPQPLVQRGP